MKSTLIDLAIAALVASGIAVIATALNGSAEHRTTAPHEGWNVTIERDFGGAPGGPR